MVDVGFDPTKLGRCPGCGDAVYRDDDHWEVTRKGEEDPSWGTSLHYHDDCAPFGATSIPGKIENERRRQKRGAEMRAELAGGRDATEEGEDR